MHIGMMCLDPFFHPFHIQWCGCLMIRCFSETVHNRVDDGETTDDNI